MRETVGKLNRIWLAIIGVLMLIAGVVGILLASGIARSVADSNDFGFKPAGAEESVFPRPPFEVLGSPVAAATVLVVAAIIGLLALGWLISQIPRRHQAGTFRLQPKEGRGGYTQCDPKSLASAVETETAELPGVTSATALIRGSANQPELNLDLKVDDRADIQDIIHRISKNIAPNLESALEAPLLKIGVIFNVANRPSKDKVVLL